MIKSNYLNNKYTVKLINERINYYDNRYTYDVSIRNNDSKSTVLIDRYKPSPMLSDPQDIVNDALSFIVSMSIEYYEDGRDEDTFRNVHDLLHQVMSHADMEELDLLFYDMENDQL